MFRHIHRALCLPVAQDAAVAEDRQPFEVTQLRGAHLQAHGLVVVALLTGLLLTGCHALGERRRIEEGILGDVDPVVIHRIAGTLGSHQFQTVRLCQPLRPCLLLTAHHAVEVVDTLVGLHGLVQLAHPMESVERPHLVLFGLPLCEDVQHQFLSKGRLILKIESDSHTCF